MDAKTRKEIQKKAELHETTKKKIKERIEENIGNAIKNVEEAKSELLDEVDAEFGENPFAEFLAGADSEEGHTGPEAKKILAKKIPQHFGPDDGSFKSLYKEIDSLNEWRKKPNPVHLVPKNITVKNATLDTISVSWDKVKCDCYYEIELRSGKQRNEYRTFESEYTFRGIKSGVDYEVKVRTVVLHNAVKPIWSKPITVRAKDKFLGSVWRKCPEKLYYKKKYSVDGSNPRIATKTGKGDEEYCTIIGNTPLPLNTATSWNIKVLKSKWNGGDGINIGVAPSDINQNESDNYNKCGWYVYCYLSTLYSGPPHSCSGNEYGPRKGDGNYVHTGDSVGVVMDTAKGELSFVLNGVNLGVAYKGIPLDKPLVPCVILKYEGDSVELVI